jgi:hypothetical protein
MKISEIKSEEVREEAVRLAMDIGYHYKTKEKALNGQLGMAFTWDETPQGGDFWYYLIMGETKNTPDLKLPEKNPSEAS